VRCSSWAEAAGAEPVDLPELVVAMVKDSPEVVANEVVG
jgi:hypothetical protein